MTRKKRTYTLELFSSLVIISGLVTATYLSQTPQNYLPRAATINPTPKPVCKCFGNTSSKCPILTTVSLCKTYGCQWACSPPPKPTVKPTVTPTPQPLAKINCDQTIPNYDYASLGLCSKNYLIQIAKAWMNNTGHPFMSECLNDAIKLSLAAGVNPKFTVWIWLNKSDASNYTGFNRPVADFGITNSSTYNNWIAQIDTFLGLPRAYASCGTDLTHFMAMYFTGDCNLSDIVSIGGVTKTVQQWVDYYLGTMNNSWNIVACDGSSPSIY